MEEDKKVELDSDIWKKYEKKEAKNLKKIFITIFLLVASIYIVKFLRGFFNMKNQSTRKLEKDLLKLHTKYFTDTDKLAILHLILDSKIADVKDVLKPQGVPEKEIDNIIQEYKKNKKKFTKTWRR